MLPTEFRGNNPLKRDTQTASAYPRKLTRTTYFWKLKGSYTPVVKVTHMTDTGYEPDPDEPDPAEGPKEEGEEEDISDIMTVLAETTMGDPDEGSGFVKGIYKLGAEVEKKT